MEELFMPFNYNKDTFYVEVQGYSDDYKTVEVHYKGSMYTLKWNDYFGYFRGTIDGVEGYIY